jgi:hypothetical protein
LVVVDAIADSLDVGTKTLYDELQASRRDADRP